MAPIVSGGGRRVVESLGLPSQPNQPHTHCNTYRLSVCVRAPQTACLDFVVPSPAGTTWGLGGTCVNVGCIPKKLMHQAGLLGEGLSDAKGFGWKLSSDGHDWEKLVAGVQDYIGSLNWGYRVALRDNNVTYLNAKGMFLDAHTLQCTKKNGQVLSTR
jgi:hypothetical protein